jgi:hypothetical protein
MLKLIKNQARANDRVISFVAVLIGIPAGTCLLLLVMTLLRAIFGVLN